MCSSPRRDRLNDIEHLGDRFAEVRDAFPGKDFTVRGETGRLVPLRMSIAVSPSKPSVTSRARASR